MKKLKNIDKDKLKEKCGSGFNYGFNSFDGSIDSGYRINYRPNGGWECLDISLCHIYYGK